MEGPLDWKDIRANAAKFAIRYRDAKKEASYKQVFWKEFLELYGVDAVTVGAFEYYVKRLGDKAGEIDYFWPGKVIIEHKSSGKDLDAAMDQAMGYLEAIEDRSEMPRYIIVSDFRRIRLLDLENSRDTTIRLEELPDNVELFGFLAGYSNKKVVGQHPVNVKAAERMGDLYDMLTDSGYPKEDLDVLLIRLVFCMFAEDAEIFERNSFSSYLTFNSREDGTGLGESLASLFSVLDTKVEDRQKATSAALSKFPYVNGGLFRKRISTPMFDRGMRACLLNACCLDWRYISPAIFGSLFQSIMDPTKRRELGAHYTSEENILKAIGPLFMNDLRARFEKIKKNPKELDRFREELSKIRILDPACGCGNFLIISYRELRRLEMDVLEARYKSQMIFDESRLFIDHFYGIEIGEFPAMVANLSMILMDHLMNLEMRNRFGRCRDIIPLREHANIVCADSLRIEWSSLVEPSELTYIVGNPPFVGYGMQSSEQKDEMRHVFVDSKGASLKCAGKMDFVTTWYAKSAKMIKGTSIHAALVSTNSIVQGEQVAYLWDYLIESYGVQIDFAYRTFKWSNEAKGVAAVHCVIIGFSCVGRLNKYIFSENGVEEVDSINPYLVPGPYVSVRSRKTPVCNVPPMITGNRPADGGHLIIEDDVKSDFVASDPASEKYIRPLVGSEEFIQGKKRWCLWLKDVEPSEVRQCPEVLKRIQKCKEDREQSPDAGRRKLAATPMLFREQNSANKPYIVVPAVSSEQRRYIPMGIVEPDVICTNLMLMVLDGTLYHFGILTSYMHMVWTSHVCGRLKSDYRYSRDVVYNNFPWPEPDEAQRREIEKLAQGVLDARDAHPGESLASLYDPRAMPRDLVEAHEKLDRAVEKAYRRKAFKNDDERISFLFQRFKELSERPQL